MVRSINLWPLKHPFRKHLKDVPQNKLVDVKGGKIVIGRDLIHTPHYGWDNEFGDQQKETIKDF